MKLFLTSPRSAYLFFIGLYLLFAGHTVQASLIVSYDFTGQPGTQAIQAPSGNGTGITGADFARGGGLNTDSEANTISSKNWGTESTDFFTFGFDTDSLTTVDLTNLQITTRSSDKGPGELGLYSDQDAFTTPIFTFIQAANDPLNSDISLAGLSPVGPGSSIEFRILQIGNSQPGGGGNTSNGGTFSVANFNQAPGTPVTINGKISSAVPEPSAALLLFVVGAATIALHRRRRRSEEPTTTVPA